MPLVRSRVATVSEGWAPCSSQWRARSSSMLIVEGSVCGLYWPIVSIVRPSRGERLSATTMRQIGFFFEPTCLSLIRTAIGAPDYRFTLGMPGRGAEDMPTDGDQRLRIFGRGARWPPPANWDICCGVGIRPLAIAFIITFIWSNCLTRLFPCVTLVPEPVAIRLRLEPLMIPGFARSRGVIER